MNGANGMAAGRRKYLLIDGHSLAYRAFFALPSTMTTTGGQPTNAVYGFTSMLLKVIEDEKPDAVLVAFDGPRSELKRLEKYPEYKAHRPAMPDELRPQIEMIQRLLEAMKIPVVSAAGHEADDILGTFAKNVSEQGAQATIVSGDRDTLQLVGQWTRVVMTGRGLTETTVYDREAVEDRYGVPPEKMPDIAGLKGDPSDNIPGVPGIGGKGATTLIREYGSLENVYEHLDEITGAKRKNALEVNRELAFLSRDLSIIDTDVPIDIDPREVEFGSWDRQEVLDHLASLEFRVLARRFTGIAGTGVLVENGSAGEPIVYTIVDSRDAGALDSFQNDVESNGSMAFCAVLRGAGYCDVELEAIAMATDCKVLVIEFKDGDPPVPATLAVRKMLSSKAIEKWSHESKAALEALDKIGITVENITFDTAVAAYLENPSLSAYDLWGLWEKNSGREIYIEGKTENIELQPSLIPGEKDDREIGLATSAARIFHLKAVLSGKLQRSGMLELFEQVEMPLLIVLKAMEETGVALDSGWVRGLAEDAGEVLSGLEKEIYELAGHELNIGSPKQLAQVLFEEMGIPPLKKKKTGYSTDSSVLESLKGEHEIAVKILEYREYSKLKSTYFDVLPGLVCSSTGRIHCAFNQMVTATGRISSSNPNLQNIPVRTDVGKKIRTAFVPGRRGWKMLVADYSQIELRVLAHMSGDRRLIDAFHQDEDVHRDTASRLLGVQPEHVTPEQRRMAKMVNFGIVYGMGAYGLSSRLDITREEAKRFIDDYFQEYPGVRLYIEKCIEEASERGYAETLFGRRRYIPQLASDARQTRELGERLAINTPLQGTAADIIKKAMIEVSAALAQEGMESRMTLQIHDELIFEAHPDEVETLTGLVRELMAEAVTLNVELKVEVGVHDNWGQAK